jgi:hypothetical protein
MMFFSDSIGAPPTSFMLAKAGAAKEAAMTSAEAVRTNDLNMANFPV